jgi:hypothetical protein
MTKSRKYITDDIYLLTDFLDNSDSVLKDIKEECPWNDFTINDKILCRTGCFQGDQLSDGSTPWLRCPSNQNQTILPWSPIIKKIRDCIKENQGHETNIGKIQKYSDGKSVINLHSDKILDLDQDTPIFIIRFGATRTCILQHKLTHQKINVLVPHNSCLVLTYKANLEWKHGIAKDINEKEPSYSIVFRKSVTYRASPEIGDYIYGVNTPAKTKDMLLNYINNKKEMLGWDEYNNLLVKCYNEENKTVANLSLYKEIIDNSIFL